MNIKRVPRESLVSRKMSGGIWDGSNIAEVFPADGDTKMSCGIHELFASEAVIENSPVDDVLYILEGELELESDGVVEKFRSGDFAYLRAGTRQIFRVRDRVKHIYVTYPRNWAQP